MRIEIDSEACTGHGRCYSIAPELFDADDEGRGVVIDEVVPREAEDAARRTVANCPERAIRMR